MKNPSANAGDLGSIPGSGRSPGEGHGNPLQCSCLENLRDRGAWWAAVYGVAKSQTRLKRLSSSSNIDSYYFKLNMTFCIQNRMLILRPQLIKPVSQPFHFHAVEKEMATHSSVLAWRIPGTGDPGGLPSLWLHRVRHD